MEEIISTFKKSFSEDRSREEVPQQELLLIAGGNANGTVTLSLAMSHKLNILLPCVCWLLSCVCLFETPWTVASQAPLSIEFSRQEYCSGLPFPSSTDLSSPGIEPGSPELQADSLPSEPPGQALLIYSDHTI